MKQTKGYVCCKILKLNLFLTTCHLNFPSNSSPDKYNVTIGEHKNYSAWITTQAGFITNIIAFGDVNSRLEVTESREHKYKKDKEKQEQKKDLDSFLGHYTYDETRKDGNPPVFTVDSIKPLREIISFDGAVDFEQLNESLGSHIFPDDTVKLYSKVDIFNQPGSLKKVGGFSEASLLDRFYYTNLSLPPKGIYFSYRLKDPELEYGINTHKGMRLPALPDRIVFKGPNIIPLQLLQVLEVPGNDHLPVSQKFKLITNAAADAAADAAAADAAAADAAAADAETAASPIPAPPPHAPASLASAADDKWLPFTANS